MNSRNLSYSSLLEIADSLGFSLVTALNIEDANEVLSKQTPNLSLWQESGYAATMEFMKRPVSLFSDLKNFLPEVKSVLSFLVPYADPRLIEPECIAGFGKVARYARGKDYHIVLKNAGKCFGDKIRDGFGINYRMFTDAVPLLERAIAVGGGLGFQGKSTMLIRPGLGTYTFIGELLLDTEITDIPELKQFKSDCGSCTRCLSLCPTQAFSSPYVLDARKCISWLTIEKRESHSPEETRAVGNWVFGCDICQEVCPFNSHGKKNKFWDSFSKEKGVGPLLNLSDVIKIRKNADFKKRFFETPILRAKREGLIRNALSVISNQGYSVCWEIVAQCLLEDESEIVRSQARQTLQNFSEMESGAVLRGVVGALSRGRS